MSTYNRTVKAALAETKGKFALAEALALDIPKQQGKAGVNNAIDAARQAIIDAGGEEKSPLTLANYRRTALHFYCKQQKFSWVKGVSYTAHQEACMVGISPAAFAKLPASKRTVAALRGTKKPIGESPTNDIRGRQIEKEIAENKAQPPLPLEAMFTDLATVLKEIGITTTCQEFEEKTWSKVIEMDRDGAALLLDDFKNWVARLEAELYPVSTTDDNVIPLRASGDV